VEDLEERADGTQPYNGGRRFAPTAVLLERTDVMESIAQLAQDASRERGRVLFLIGDAGTGKSSLLAAAEAIAPHLRSFRAQGYLSEANLPFALIEQLFGAPQSVAWDMGTTPKYELASPSEIDPLERRAHFHHHARATLRAWTGRGGVLILIDDLHLADSASLATLGFLARRIQDVAVLFIASLRSWPPDAQGLASQLAREGHAKLLTLPPLSEAASTALLEAYTKGAVSRAVAHKTFLATHGNPYLLVQAAAVLERDWEHPAPFSTTITPDAIALITHQLAGLSTSSVWCAEIAAVLGSPIDINAMETLAALTAEEFAVALDALLSAHILERASANRVRFNHDLLAEAILTQMPLGRRRLLHSKAFEHFAARHDLNTAAWHALSVPLVGDRRAIDVLEQAGVRALEGGDNGSAVHLLEAGVQLSHPTPDPNLLVAYGDALFLSDHADEACACYRQAIQLATTKDEVELQAKLARAMAFTGHLDDAVSTLNHLLATDHNEPWPTRAAWLAEHAHLVWERDGPVAAAETLSRDLAQLESVPGQDVMEPTLQALKAYFELQAGEPAAMARLEEAIRNPHHGTASSLAFSFQATHLLTGSFATNERYEEAAREIQASLTRLALAGRSRAAVPLRILKMGIALRRAQFTSVVAEAVKLADDFELDALQAPHVALLHAGALSWLGDFPTAAKLLDAVEGSTHLGSWFEAVNFCVAKGEHLLALGQPREALAQFRDAAALIARFGIRHPQLPRWCGGAIEASFAVGDIKELDSILAWLEDVDHMSFGTWPKMIARAGEAARMSLAGASAEVDSLYAEALAAPGDHPLDRVRIGIRYGAWLRRQRRLLDARPILAASLRIAEEHSMRPLVERARAELIAAGGRRRAIALGYPLALTPQEERAATLAAAGATVKEIAAAMYLSPRTVETHLGRAYRKLGVSSKLELRQRLGKNPDTTRHALNVHSRDLGDQTGGA